MTQSVETGANQPMKIVLVDDDALVLRVHAEMLRSMGYIPFTFESPEDALDYLRGYREHVAMVITDYRMPQMNGLEFLGRLRHFDSHTPVTILTAFASEVDRKMAEKCKAELIHKPIRMHLLGEHVQSTLLKKKELASTCLS